MTTNPLDAMDETVRAEFEHDGRTVSAWVLIVQTQEINPESAAHGLDPLRHSARYSVGPGTTPATALGLADGMASTFRRIMRSDLEDE